MSKSNGALPPMSWWKWRSDVPGTNPIFVRGLIIGVYGRRGTKEDIREIVAQDVSSARQFYGELAFRISARNSVNGLTWGMREFLAECLERISHGEDSRDVFELRRQKGDKRKPEEIIWAQHCVIETLRFNCKLSEHQAHCLLAEYFDMGSESIYRKTKSIEFSEVTSILLGKGDVIAFGPGMDDLVNLIPHFFPNHKI